MDCGGSSLDCGGSSSRADRGLTEIKIMVPMLQNFKNYVKNLVSSTAESWTV